MLSEVTKSWDLRIWVWHPKCSLGAPAGQGHRWRYRCIVYRWRRALEGSALGGPLEGAEDSSNLGIDSLVSAPVFC